LSWWFRCRGAGGRRLSTRQRRLPGPTSLVADTDWLQIPQLYDQLMAIAPSPIVALNRAVAVAEVDGPEVALALVDDLELDGYYLFHAIRADLLGRIGRNDEAAHAYEAAIARTDSAAAQAFLQRNSKALMRRS